MTKFLVMILSETMTGLIVVPGPLFLIVKWLAS